MNNSGCRRPKFFVAVAEELHLRARRQGWVSRNQTSARKFVGSSVKESGSSFSFARSDQQSAHRPAILFCSTFGLSWTRLPTLFVPPDAESRGEIGRLRLGFVSTAAHGVIPRRLPVFEIPNPAVELLLTELNSDEGLEALCAGQLDLLQLLLPPRSVDPALNIELV